MSENCYKKQRSIRHKERPKKFMGHPRPALAPLPSNCATPVRTQPVLTSTSSYIRSVQPVPPDSTSIPIQRISTRPVPVPVSSRSRKKIALSRPHSNCVSQPGPCADNSAISQPGLPTDSSPAQPAPSTSSPISPSADNMYDYHIIRMKSLVRAVGRFTCCGSPITVIEDRCIRRGLVSKIALCCTVCKKESDPYSEEDLEVNDRSLLAMRAIGQGRAGLATFTGIMSMLPPISASNTSIHNAKLKKATNKVCEANQAAAAKHLRKNAADDEVVDVQITCDGTWARRGHQSLHGVLVVASWETGQVLDTEVLSKYCHTCNKKRNADTTSDEFLDWWEGHQAECCVNYSGSSGAMEVEEALRIRRSVSKHKLRYTSVISDGDSTALVEANPYGNAHPIVKFECVGHVQKRMHNRLKALKSRVNTDKNGKVVKIGGRGRITEEKMKLFQRYYGKSVCSNVNDALRMKNAVMAIFYHSISTDIHPLHFKCPAGETSWCKFQRAKAKGEPPPKHKQTIPYEVAPFVKKVFL